MGQEWEKEGINQAFSAETYITNVKPKLAKSCELEEFRKWNMPFSEEYYPELDDIPSLSMEKISIYKSLLGSASWIITNGRFDIAYSTNVLARYIIQPREGNYIAPQRVFCYLRQRSYGMLFFDVDKVPIRDELDLEGKTDWTECYPNAVEYLLLGRAEPKGKSMTITCFVDADHARDKVTKGSVISIIMLLNNTPISWTSKRLKTAESYAYGSEMVASRIAVKGIISMRYFLSTIEIGYEKSSLLFDDKMAVVLNTPLPSSTLKKKH